MQRQVARPVRRGAVGKVPARVTRWPPTLRDGVFFLDLPSAREKAAIWELYIRRYELDPDQRRPADRQWTGAEIRSCCRLARLLDLSLVESGRQIGPVAATASESVDRLRTWASGRCLSAEVPGLYNRPSGEEPGRTAGRSGRRVGRDGPSAN